jgi:hypothetical protein
VPGIKDLSKPPGVRCEHMAVGGCGRYDTRPGVCREYECLWLRMPDTVPGDLRPDLCGVLLSLTSAGRLGIPGAAWDYPVVRAQPVPPQPDVFASDGAMLAVNRLRRLGLPAAIMHAGRIALLQPLSPFDPSRLSELRSKPT